MSRCYSPSQRLSEWVAALLSPYIKVENDGGQDGDGCDKDDEDIRTTSFSSKLLSVGLWSGYVELKNVELRPEALEQFLNRGGDNHGNGDDLDDCPATIRWKLVRGSIDCVKIQIPWKNLLVGSVYSSSKPSGEGRKKQEDEEDVENVAASSKSGTMEDEPALASSSGRTTIHIQGVRLRFGYEVIHSDPLINTWQQRQKETRNLNNSDSLEDSTSPVDDQLRMKIREEKNRILQIAERRLRAGVDPFPPSLVDGLNSLMSRRNNKPMPLQSGTTSTTTTYLSRIENYLSSTIKSLIWRLFCSLSISMAQVHISGVGQSHYDKYSNGGETSPRGKRRRRSQYWEDRNETSRFHSDTQEWEVEVGVTLNRLDIGPDSPSNPGNSTLSESVAKKRIIFNGMGAFVRRIPKISPVGFNDKGLTTDNTVLWKDSVHGDDYVMLPMDIAASCKVYRDRSESSKNWSTQSKTERMISGTAGTSIGSDASTSTKRRGKRDKPQKTTSKTSLSTSVMSGPVPTRDASLNPQGHNSISSDTPRPRPSGTDGLFLPRLEFRFSIGHVRICFSPRQIFLLHSLSTSMTRTMNGRPATTIRAAKAYDRRLYARMAEEGECVMAWDDHIYRALPALQSCFSQRSMRPLPKVVSFWWKYAFINTVYEVNHRTKLLGRGRRDIAGRERNTSCLSRGLRPEKQSRIREEYIELYLSARVPNASPTDVVVLTDGNSRLEQIEDQMSVEQILLLRHVAWAASIRCASAGTAPGQALGYPSPYKMYHCFSPNTHAHKEEKRFSAQCKLDSDGDVESLTSLLLQKNECTKSQASVIGVTEKQYTDDYTSRKTFASAHTKQRQFFPSFSAEVFVSGFSFALCDFSSGSSFSDAQASNAEKNDQCIIPDDISALTGYSDDDSKTPMLMNTGETTFDPSHRFWSDTRHGVQCNLIMLTHIIDVVFSLRSDKDDHLHPQLVQSEFSVRGITILSGHASKQQNLLCLGYNFSEESLAERRGAGKQLIGVSGRSFKSPFLYNISSVELSVDWEWLKNMQRLVSKIRDIVPIVVQARLPAHSDKRSENFAFGSMNIGEITLTASLDSVEVPNSGDEEQVLVVATKYVYIKNGNSHDSSPMKSSETANPPKLMSEVESSSCKPTRKDLTFDVEGFDILIVTQKNGINANAITRKHLLRFPISIQLRHNGGSGSTSREQSSSSFQSFHVTVPSIQLLISELRVRAILKAVKIITHELGNAVPTPDQASSSSSTVSDFFFVETKFCSQSIGIFLVPEDDEERTVDGSSYRNKLEYVIGSFINHLSCLDFEHPCQKAFTCMSRILLDNLSGLGIPDQKAKKCMESARANFLREAGTRFYSTSSRHRANSTRRSNANPCYGLNPESLSDELDEIARNATFMTIADIGDFNPIHSNFELALDAESFSMCLHDRGKTVQVSAKSLRVRRKQDSLLYIHRNGNNNVTSPAPSVSDGNDVALKIVFQDGSVGNNGISFEADCVQSMFDPDVYLDLIKFCSILMRAVSSASDGSVWRNRRRTKSGKDTSFHGNVSSFALVMTNNLIPFVECQLHHVIIEKPTIGCRATAPTSFQARSVFLDCVCTSTYPNIISTYSSQDGEVSNVNYALRMTFHSLLQSSYDCTVVLDGVRITLLRQLLNDVLQYLSSPNYGFGLLLSRLEFDMEEDSDSYSVPSKLNLIVANSSIVLPRDSASIDMVGIEAEKISLIYEQADDTWSIDDCSFLDDIKDPVQTKRQNGTSSSSEFFFECNNEDNINNTSALIPRFAVHVWNAHLFTALNQRHFSTKNVHMPSFLASVQVIGRAEQSKSPFIVSGKISKSMAEDLQFRSWERVSKEPLNLMFMVDYVPTLRVLIEDIDHGDSRGISVGMRMSQYCLLMSVWFSNNQELPVFFPYEVDALEKLASDRCPPTDWPDYGTSEFVERLKRGIAAKVTYEMAICFTNLSWRCEYDHRNYFSKVPSSASMMQPLEDCAGEISSRNFISVALDYAVFRITTDEDSLQRISIGAVSIHVLDGRQSEATFKKGIFTERRDCRPSSVDLNWGIDCGCHTLIHGLPLPFQSTVLITPDMRCMINLGVGMAEATLFDLSLIWIFLDYFGLYFKQSEYGNPLLEAELVFGKNTDKIAENDFLNDTDNNYCSIDFRLLLTHPILIIPSSSEACIMLEAGAIFYRYMSVGDTYSSQEINAHNLGVIVMSEYMAPSKSRGLRHISGSLSSCGVKTLIDEMSFSLRYDFNAMSNYTRLSLRVPLTPQHFDPRSMDGIECLNGVVQPFSVPSPSVCKPFVVPTRDMRLQGGCIFFSYEYTRLAFDLLIAFLGPYQQDESCTSGNASQICEKDGLASQCQFSFAAHVEGVKCVLCDPVMGMHRPFVSVCVPSLFLNMSKLKDPRKFFREESMDMQVSIEMTFFIDYFKLGLTRNWEPLVEPFKCLVMYEMCATRGKGVTFNADCPLHINITSAVIETIDDGVKTYELFREGNMSGNHPKWRSLDSKFTKDFSSSDHNFLHRIADHLHENERVAFSLKNSTGERIRVYTHSALESVNSTTANISYLDQSCLMPLSFPATETVISNMRSLELPFKGDQNIASDCLRAKTVINLELGLQVPGFRWIRKISLNKPGNRFVPLIPRSSIVQAKVNEDWRLRNALQILAEVSSVNGGRRLSIKSPFEIINKTNHPILVASDPNPRHSPYFKSKIDDEKCPENNHAIDKVYPDETHSISFLLLESALHLVGNHLGCIWIKPDQASGDDVQDALLSPGEVGLDTLTISFPSRPIQLAKILHESSRIFKDSDCDPFVANQVASGIEVSCPTFDDSKCRSSRPFCYVVEVKKSPFSKTTENVNKEIAADEITGRVGKGLKSAKNIFYRGNASDKTEIHAPIAYSLVIHPPLVLENLLPERARFELMHASTRNVLWWGCLEAGERVSVHNVGLDAPILLLLNLGFCKTAVGEGALIHHGGGDGHFKAGWNSIQGAMKTSKDRVKKTLTTISESKDDRGAKRVAMIKAGRNAERKDGSRKVGQLGTSCENEIIEKSEGTLPRRGDGFGVEDIASELCVVDSLGQRLTLQIENILGGGGQRNVSVYSPFWIVNTTEHSLRYKQEKSVQFVAGTVLSQVKDGSKPVDGGYRSRVDEEDFLISESYYLDSLGTIFSGQPGALSLLKRNFDCCIVKPELVAALISNDLPLHVLSNLAFMFNFHDVISLGGSPRLCIQLADTSDDRSRFTSDWSSGFGLQSIGVTQIVGMHCKDGRGLEVSVSVSIAPGRLSNYTKIVRICPRYVVVNQLSRPIRLWQDDSLLHPNLPVEHSSGDVTESRKWVFADTQERIHDIVNQYELLFGSPTWIPCDAEIGLDSHTAAHRDACYIATVRPSELVPFHLPDTRLERTLRVDLGPFWYLSPSFAADVPGEYHLTINPARDLRMLPPASSRVAPVYAVAIPSTGQTNEWRGELGVWFETEPWGRERSLIVKGVKPGSYASNFTDISVGDELIMIDATATDTLTFAEAMKFMKSRLAAANEFNVYADQSPKASQFQLMMNKKKKLNHRSQAERTMLTDNSITLTFLTHEERLRRLRRAAVSKNDGKLFGENTNISKVLKSEMIPEIDHASTKSGTCSDEILVEMKFLFQSVFVFLRAPDPMDPPHRVINRSLHWRIYYRQRSCDSHPWRCLAPGESAAYTWEEPMKAKKLSVRVGIDDWNEDEMKSRDGVSNEVLDEDRKRTLRSAMPYFSFQFIKNEEAGYFGTTKTINLDEIGNMDKLPCPSFRKERSLICQVDTEGATRVLIVSDDVVGVQATDETIVRRHLEHVRKDIAFLARIRKEICALKETLVMVTSPNDGPINFGRDFLTGGSTINEYTGIQIGHSAENIHRSRMKSDAIENELHELVDFDEGRFITKRNQVVVEVLEATGLRSSDLNGLSNPYAKVGLIYAMKKRRVGSFANKLTWTTYYIPKTLSPQWSDQSFVFDVPERASDPGEIRRISILCVVKSAEIGKNKFLGQAHIHLNNIKDQKEHVGWYPLGGNIGQSGISNDPLEKIRGSIRLRVQWIYDTPGLLDYYLLCTERRMSVLQRRNDGLKRQLKSVHDAAQKVREKEESFAIVGVPALALLHKKKRRVNGAPPSTDAKEDFFHQSSNRIRAVSARDKMKKTITAARFMGRIKRLSDIDNKNESTTLYHSGSTFANEIGVSSIGDANIVLDSQEWIADNAGNASLIDSYLSSTGEDSCCTSTTASTCLRRVSDVTEINPNPQTPNIRLSHLRWQSWQHRTDDGLEFSPRLKRKIFRHVFNHNVTSPATHTKEERGSDEIDELLMLPPTTPPLIVRREKYDMCELLRSRDLFSKAARRSLGSIFNPGGVLTIRPITALNLPDHFTSMFLKLRYGNIVKSTISVDSKVAPVWSDDDEHLYFSHLQVKRLKRELITKQNSSSDAVINDTNDIAEMINPTRASGARGNDLNIQVEPFETSKSLRLTVIGESPLQVNVEIGVLEIPLGAALECCSQCLEDFEEDRKKRKPQGLPPTYIRWFPLMPPSECVPIEGDMGKHIRPLETEKLHDNMFEEYFTPCIKLAMVFQPNLVGAESDYANVQDSANTNRPSTCHYLYFRLDRISAALIDSSRIMELISFTAREADVRYSVTSAKTRLAVAIGDVQLDQQNYGMNTKVPVIMTPTPVKCPQPIVQFLCWKDNIRSTCDVDSYEYVALQVQEMDLKMEDSLLFDLWEFYMNILKLREAKAILWQLDERAIFSTATFQVERSTDAVEKASLFLKVGNESKKKKIYVRELILGFFKINVSYFKSPPRGSWVDSDKPNESLLDVDNLHLFSSPSMLSNSPPGGRGSAVDDEFIRWSENSTRGLGLDETSQHASINIIAAVFPSISKAPIRFQERVIYHVFESEGDIWRSLKSYYSAEALRQIYKIVGSLDFVGNPNAVITSFRSGLQDFFLQPSRELKHITSNPSRFGVGVLKGTLSLVSNSASGIFGFASNVAATVGNTATLLTLDEHYQRLHCEQKVAQQRHYDRWKKKGFGHITLMVSRPVHDIVLGVVSASTGLLTEPYRGAKNDGIPGVIKGTAIGVIGVVVKPIVGLSDAFAHVMESIDDIAKSMNLLELKFKPVERYRTPYVFGFKRMLLPFNEVDSRSAQLLLAYPIEKKLKITDETIVASEALYMGNGMERYVVVSTIRVALFRLKVVDGQGFCTTTLEWQIRFGKDCRVTCSVGNKGHNGCFLCISRYCSQGEEEVQQMKCEHDEHQSDISSAEDESKQFPFPDTPKSFQPFKFSNLWPIAANESYLVSRYIVEGEFKHRQQLCRIHNSICCIIGDFDSIINERNRIDDTEGITSFGPLNFERESTIPTPKSSSDLESFYASLESTMWIIPCRLSDSFNHSFPRCPSWLVDSRARNMYSGTASHSLPSDHDNGDNVIAPLSSEPDIRLRYFDDSMNENTARQMLQPEWSMNDHSAIDGLSYNVSFPSVDDRDRNNCIDEFHSAHSGFVDKFDVSSFAVCSNPPCHRQFANKADCDKSILPTFPHQSAQLAPEELEIVDAGNVGSRLDERLRRVESMLDKLLHSSTETSPTDPTLSHQSHDIEATFSEK